MKMAYHDIMQEKRKGFADNFYTSTAWKRCAEDTGHRSEVYVNAAENAA